MADIPEPLQALKTERSRLETLLNGDRDWLAMRRLGPGAGDDTERARLVAVLASNRLYMAWVKIDEAIQLLAPPTPELTSSGTQPEPVELPDSELMRIRGIDREMAHKLTGEGVGTLVAMAALNAKEVRRIRKALDLDRRLSQENWIEQAALLVMKPSAVVDQAPSPPKDVVPMAAPADAPIAPQPSLAAALAASAASAAQSAPEVTQEVALRAIGTPAAQPSAASLTCGVAASSAASLSGDSAAPAAGPSARVASPSAGPSSLPARLFARAPLMGGDGRSILATIQAAEQVRRGRLTDALDAVAKRYEAGASAPVTPVQSPTTQVMAPAAPTVAPRPTVEAVPAAVAETSERSRFAAPASVDIRPSTPLTKSQEPAASASGAMSAHKRVTLAPFEEEAEVTIVRRADAPAPAVPKPVSSAPILPLDSELQGGEDDDARALAAYRGVIEEASVEIVKREPGKPRPGTTR